MFGVIALETHHLDGSFVNALWQILVLIAPKDNPKLAASVCLNAAFQALGQARVV
jgi:hypothetical protein